MPGAISSPEFRNPFTVIVVRGTVGKIFHNLRKTKIEKKIKSSKGGFEHKMSN